MNYNLGCERYICSKTSESYRRCISCNTDKKWKHTHFRSCHNLTQAREIKARHNPDSSMTRVNKGVGKMPEGRRNSYHHSGPHTELHPHRDESRKREDFFFTSIRLSWGEGRAIVTLAREKVFKQFTMITHCGQGHACESFKNRSLYRVCGWLKASHSVPTFRTRSWSSIMPRSLPAAWAILFPATRLPTITDAGPTPTTRARDCDRD